MTITQILNFGKNTNTTIELNGARSYLKRTASCISGELYDKATNRFIKPKSISAKHLRFPELDRETQNRTFVGIEVRTRYSDQYYWFMTFDDVNDPDAYWFFDHAYNRNTGQSVKKRGKRVLNLISKIEQH